MYITVNTWVNGDPIEIRRIGGVETKEQGLAALRDIGHSWQYDIDHVARLHADDGTEIGRLNIWEHTYQVMDLSQ